MFYPSEVAYKAFRNELPPGWAESTTPSFDLAIPIDRDFLTTDSLRVLLVIEHINTADLRCGKLFGSKASNVPMTNVLAEARILAEQCTGVEQSVSYAAINFNYFKTYHLETSQYNTAQSFAARRVYAFIKQTKPDLVLVFGDEAASALLPKVEYVIEKRGWLHTLQVGDHETKVVTTLRIEDDLFGGPYGNDASTEESGSKIADRANLLGFISRCVANGFAGHLLYDASDVKPNVKVVDTIPKFKRLFHWLREKRIIAVDLETENLSVHNNKILTLQFAFNSGTSYLLPYRHKNTPFSVTELAYIRPKLRSFFGQKLVAYAGKNTRYLVGQNLKFDLRILRQELGIPHIYWPVWDTIAGEFCLDENLKSLKSYGGSSWGLASMFARYGNDFYLTASFSKKDRASISEVDLTQEVLDYSGMDAQAVFKIHELQLARSTKMTLGTKSFSGYYERFVLTQMSNIIRVMSLMEQRGALLDRKQLLHLMESDSEINGLLSELEDKLKEFPTVQEANKILLKTEGVPNQGLFGSVDMWIFNLGKPYHKYVLFIDVLGLAPVFYGKSITPDGEYMAKIDKVFQKTHSHVPEVALLTEIQKAKKIKTSYVDAFYRRLCTDPDSKHEGRIRPGYGYQDVLTGRSNSFSPSLQQIPQHSAVAKLIKRLFIAPEGKLTLKIDFSTHEVRGWGIISKDTEVGKSFQVGKNCRIRYRLNPTPENLERVKLLGDPHKTNYSSFTGTPVKDITDEMRRESKGITFGSIYGMSIPSLAESIHKPVEYAQKVYDSFFAKFRKAAGWLNWATSFSKKNLYVYSPLGRRRNLPGYLAGTKYLDSSLGRRAKNCLTGEHLVDTNIGVIPLKDLVGKTFQVRTAYGNYSPCQGAESRGIKNVVRVVLNDGTVLRGTADHPIRILGSNLEYTWKALGTLQKTDYVVKVSTSSSTSLPGLDNISNTSHTFVPVLYTPVPDGKEAVFDIVEVEVHHHFLANGVVVSNSPIQGMASDFSFIAANLICEKMYEFQRQAGLIDIRNEDHQTLSTGLNIMVHDSIEVEAPYDLVGPVLHIMEWCATVGVRKYAKDVFNMDFIVGLEVDFDIGSLGDKLRKWDFTDASLRDVVYAALIDQKEVLGHKIDVNASLRQILESKSKYEEYLESMQLDLEEIDE